MTLSPLSRRSGEDDTVVSIDEDADPVGEGRDLGRTDADGQDDDQEQPARPLRNGAEAPGGKPEKSQKELFGEQKAKTIKTAEALSRAISDLDALGRFPQRDAMVKEVDRIIAALKALKWEANSMEKQKAK